MLRHPVREPLAHPWFFQTAWAVILLGGIIGSALYYSLTSTTTSETSTTSNPTCFYAPMTGSSETLGAGIENFNPELPDEVDCSSHSSSCSEDATDNITADFKSRCQTAVLSNEMTKVEPATNLTCLEQIEAGWMDNSTTFVSANIASFYSNNDIYHTVMTINVLVEGVGTGVYQNTKGFPNTLFPGLSAVGYWNLKQIPLTQSCLTKFNQPWTAEIEAFILNYTEQINWECASAGGLCTSDTISILTAASISTVFGKVAATLPDFAEDTCQTASTLTMTQTCTTTTYLTVAEVLVSVGIIAGTLHGYVTLAFLALDKQFGGSESLDKLEQSVHRAVSHKAKDLGAGDIEFLSSSKTEDTAPSDEVSKPQE